MSRAVAVRAVPRDMVKKAAIAGIVGLMASVVLAFLLEYVGRAFRNDGGDVKGLPRAYSGGKYDITTGLLCVSRLQSGLTLGDDGGGG